MANRIVGNVIIVDSAMGNVVLLTSANQAVNLDELSVSAFGFWSVDTTSAIILTEANTATDLVYIQGYFVNGAGTSTNPRMTFSSFAKPVKIGNLKAPTVTAGTGFIYLA